MLVVVFVQYFVYNNVWTNVFVIFSSVINGQLVAIHGALFCLHRR